MLQYLPLSEQRSWTANETAEIYLILNFHLERNCQSKKSDKLMSPEFSLVLPRCPKSQKTLGTRLFHAAAGPTSYKV